MGALCYVGFCCLLEVVGEGVDGLGDAAGDLNQRLFLSMKMGKGCLLVGVLASLGATAGAIGTAIIR